MGTDQLQRVKTYLADIEQRLKSNNVPKKHAQTEGAKAAYRQWLEIERKKAQMKIAQIQGV
jgi:hypothetical protein